MIIGTDPVEGDVVRVDTRKLFMDRPVLTEVVFVKWDVAPMWEGKRPSQGCLAHAVVRSETPLRAPALESLGGGLYRVQSPEIYFGP